MLNLEMILLKLSKKIILKYEENNNLENYSSQQLCNIFELRHFDEYKSIDGSLKSITDAIKESIKMNDTIMYFIGLLCNPITYSGRIDNEGRIISSSVKMNYSNNTNNLQKEILNTLDKIIDASLIKMQQKSISEIIQYFNSIRENIGYNPKLRELSNQYFFNSWGEFTSNFKILYSREWENFDSVLLQAYENEFYKFRFKFPRVSALWSFYLFNELMQDIKLNKNNNIAFTKKLNIAKSLNTNSMSTKYIYDIHPDFLKILVSKFKKYISLLKKIDSLPTNIGKDMNKSLCLDLFNDNTKLVEAFLLSRSNDNILQLNSTYKYTSATRIKMPKYRKEKTKKFHSFAIEAEISNIGQTTIIGYSGLTYKFIKNKKRYDYNYNQFNLKALKYLYKYIEVTINKYIEEKGLKANIKEVKNNKALKNFYIYDQLKEFEPDIDCIDFMFKKLNPSETFNLKKFHISYKYLLNHALKSSEKKHTIS